MWTSATAAATAGSVTTPAPIATATSVNPWPGRNGWQSTTLSSCRFPYFHVVFTVPDPIAAIALQNKKVVCGILFRAAAAALRRIACRKGFFLPVRVLSRLFRGLFLCGLKDAYAAGELGFHGSLQPLADPDKFKTALQACRKVEWVVYSKPPFGGPQQVLDYLGRYTHRVAISNDRLVCLEYGKVTFRWKDYRQGNKQKLMTLKAKEFIRRFLLHVLPGGFVRIRHFGFLANCHRETKLALCRELLGVPQRNPQPSSTTDDWKTI